MNAEERRAAATAMLRDKGDLRLAIHGRSMLPSIAEPMVMQLGPAAQARIGDVLIFEQNDILVAHRIVALEPDGFRTAGDAQPHVVEAVPPERVVGRVAAIWSDASVAARRVDGPRHRLRGWYFARFQRARRALHLAREKARDVIERAQPRRRARLATQLVAGIAAAQRADAGALVAALRCEAAALARIDGRHRCSAVLADAARRLGVMDELAPDVAAQLRRGRMNAVLATGAMRPALERTVAVLNAAQIEFALLKGAARVYAAEPGSALHSSDDIDIFVHARDVDRAVTTLRAHGWHYRDSIEEVQRFRAHHHHAASLFSPAGNFPVEVHHALATPGSISTGTTWDTLRPHLVPLAGSAGNVLQLDALGTALHLAIHAIGLTRLRDVALLAQVLPALNDAERDELTRIVAEERSDPIRLAAAVALAARIAGVAYPERAGVDAYIRWALRREDLPRRLRLRSEAVEAYFARPTAPWTALPKLVPWWSRGAQLTALPVRVLGRCAANTAALLYAARMQSRKNESF